MMERSFFPFFVTDALATNDTFAKIDNIQY